MLHMLPGYTGTPMWLGKRRKYIDEESVRVAKRLCPTNEDGATAAGTPASGARATDDGGVALSKGREILSQCTEFN